MRWNSDDSFPAAGNRWYAWRPPFGRRAEGESAVRRATWQWHPLDPLLVSIPGAERLLPPICFPHMAAALQRRMMQQYRLLMILIACMALGFAAAGMRADEGFFLKSSVAFSLLLLFVGCQYAFIFRDIARLCGYSRFCSWCYLQSQTPVAVIILLVLFAGGGQLYLQARAGSLFGLVEQYGLEFDKAAAQPWRYVTGPLLHAGLVHWIGNFSLLLVAAGLSFPLGRPRPLWLVFIAGIYLPAFVLTYLPHWVRSDAFLGVSGGVFALFGWIAGVALKNRRVFPFGLWWFVGYFAVATAAISSLLDPRASWFAHSSGLLIGVATGMLNLGVRLNLDASSQHADGASAG